MRGSAFPSTFEDDEAEEELFVPPSLSRSRPTNQDTSRSRSHSLATGSTRPGTISNQYITSALQNWSDANSLGIPSRYGEMKPPGNNRYTSSRSPIHIQTSSSPGDHVLGNGYSNRQNIDVSNMSPFVRDVGQILLDDGSAFRELWAGMHVPRDENGGGGSGTTSRRHSVSVVQPRRNIGFNVPNNEDVETGSARPIGLTQASFVGRRGHGISDEDLASDLGMLEINSRSGHNASSSHLQSTTYPPSQPASLPIYAPISRSPASRDVLSPYQQQGIKLSIPGGTSFTSRGLRSPSDCGGTSPTVDLQQRQEYTNGGGPSAKRQSPEEELARFMHGQALQYMTSPTDQRDTFGTRARVPSLTSPIVSPNSRIINPQQTPFLSQQQRRQSISLSMDQGPSASTTHHPPPLQQPQQSSLAEVGRGLPLHSVPASWPLYIIEFKAGRTDLFYCADLRLAGNLRVGDLVIVEADRGRDLGKVLNDGITVEQVEAFQRNQAERMNGVGMGMFVPSGFNGAGFGAGGDQGDGQQPPSPGGPGSSAGARKEISPKMIYAKAQPQDVNSLMLKHQDEVKALQLCQSKVRAKKLPMEVVEAEYQWDRRKLTFYFVAEKRIDFRELVRELFRLYKTRIWMASLQGGTISE